MRLLSEFKKAEQIPLPANAPLWPGLNHILSAVVWQLTLSPLGFLSQAGSSVTRFKVVPARGFPTKWAPDSTRNPTFWCALKIAFWHRNLFLFESGETPWPYHLVRFHKKTAPTPSLSLAHKEWCPYLNLQLVTSWAPTQSHSPSTVFTFWMSHRHLLGVFLEQSTSPRPLLHLNWWHHHLPHDFA